MTHPQQAKSPRSSFAFANARRRFTPSVLVLALSSALAMPGSAFAIDWVGGTNNDWTDDTNWNPAGAPTAGQDTNVDTTGGQIVVVGVAAGATAAAGVLSVGFAAGSTGELSIENGAFLNTDSGFLGVGATSTGTVTVSGTGTTWINAGFMNVGSNTTGTLKISTQGVVSSLDDVVIGAGGSAKGTVTVDGTSSKFIITNALVVGRDGNGTLEITNGGSVSNSIGTIASIAGSTGLVTVDGANSVWTNNLGLNVGGGGSGELMISAGGKVVTVGSGDVGRDATSNGKVTVTGTSAAGQASLWEIGGAAGTTLVVGDLGTGSLSILAGGSVTNGDAFVGDGPTTSSGSVDVRGAGSTWTSTGILTVGGTSGTGSVLVENGGAISNAAAILGQTTNSTGTVTVQLGGTWDSSAALTVGDGGKGTLDIASAGVVTSVGGVIGQKATSDGKVTVDGQNSKWTVTGNLTIGQLGAGTLTISNQGVVSDDDALVGGSDGKVTVTGNNSAWNHTAAVTIGVGANSKGTLDILAGGSSHDVSAVVGSVFGSTGTVTVDGPLSAWNHDTILTIGDKGVGHLTVSGGGTVGNTTAIVGDGTNSGSGGTVLVTGQNSSWTSTNLTVGGAGTGKLDIANQGVINSANSTIAAGNGSSGAVTITGSGSQWNNDNDITIGDLGTGTLAISGSGAASSGRVFIGAQAGATGTASVDGMGSVLSVTSNLFLGDSGGGVLTISNSGAVSTDQVFVANLTGATGSLLLSGGGTLNSTGGVIGFQTGAAGIAIVDGTGSRWTNTGDLTIADAGAGTLTITNGGVVDVGGLVTLGKQGLGTLNIGSGAGSAPVAPGTLKAKDVLIGTRSATINFNHTDTSGNYTFDAAVSGPGMINHNAGVTKMTADSTGFDGQVNVNGGRLAVNGSLANAMRVNVNNGGNLGGSGTVGLTFVNAGGTVSPGNSIGTLNVNGNITFAAGSIYQVEVDPAGNTDKIIASGTAQLDGGTVQVIAGAGSYAPLTSYDILTAQGGVTGKFAGVTSNFAFLDPALSYSAKGVSLKLTRNNKGFSNVGLTPNQKAAGTGAEGLGSGNVIYDAVLGLSVAQARNSFDQLSGEIHPAARGVQLEDSRFVRDASLERLRALDSERVANDGGADPQEGKPPRLLPSVRDLAYWAHAMGSWGHVDGDGNAATVKRDTSGFLMGVDTRFGDEGRFGMVGGYSRSAFDVADRNSSGSSDNYHLGAYAGSRWGDLALRTGIAYSWHDVSTSRAVAFPGFTDSLKADYKANTTQVFAELGYRIKTEKAELEPFASLASVNVSSDGFVERGGPAALRSAGNSNGVTFSTLGLRASTGFSLDGGTSVTARGSIGWRNTLGDVTPTTSLAFAGGTPFVIAGVPIAKSAAVVEAGLDFKLSNTATLGLSYGGQFGSGLKDHSARVNLNVAF